MKTGELCKDCGAELVAEFVDIGIGWQQVTAGECPNNCDYIKYAYGEYVKSTENTLSLNDWLDSLELASELEVDNK